MCKTIFDLSANYCTSKRQDAATSPGPNQIEEELVKGIKILEDDVKQLTNERSELMDERVGNRETMMQLRVELVKQKEETRKMKQKYNREHNALVREREKVRQAKE